MTQVYKSQRIRRHDTCPVELRVTGPHIGLYCQCHNQWLKWITEAEARVALEAGVDVVFTKQLHFGRHSITVPDYIDETNIGTYLDKNPKLRQHIQKQLRTG